MDLPSWVPQACTLPTEEQPLRVAEFDALFSQAVLSVTWPRPELLRLGLTRHPETAARAAELAARETGCCSFFTFTLTIADEVTLDVAVPSEHIRVLDALTGRAAGTGSTRPRP
ncbi:hypothetical protein [Nonomuraea sediminis]|uniref:hypothetical protein n=1 Tax=Nonomuraea sediminis TaxID=2835864 RepID=UPI001BDCD900|nr:hypothetical protein [Nonomuraea sediminis]